MKAKDKTTGKIIEVTPAFGGYFSCNGELIPQGDLEFNFEPPQLKATISGWVARDSKIASNSLCFHRNEVTRGKFLWENKEANRPIGESLILPEDMFPTLTWEDEPLEVEIIIKPKKQ